MKIEIVKAVKGGFCFGVRRAVEMVSQQAGQGRVFTLGPIIHNPAVVERLSQMGVTVTEVVDTLHEGDILILRSHGVPRSLIGECERRKVKVVDATCPYVSRIHNKVYECGQKGLPVILIGQQSHPEIIGTAGWCTGACYIVYSREDILALPEMSAACVAGQTTTPQAIWDDLVSRIRERIPELEVFPSICHATMERQMEAVNLASAVDAMIVIGGKESSNSRKLYELCREICPNTWFIEDATELNPEEFGRYKKMGIASGASTPDWIIEEVYNKMSDIEVKVDQAIEPQAEEACTAQEPAEVPAVEEQEAAELSFEESVAQSVRSIRNGQVLRGTVVQVSDTEVCVNIGYKADGLVPKSDFIAEGETDVDLKAKVQVGDELEVQVKKVNDGDGNVLLSCKDLAVKRNWNKLVEEYEAENLFIAQVTGVVKGGLISSIYGFRTFIPASQVDVRFVNKLEQFVGQDIQVRIIEMDKTRRRVVASRKVVIEEAKKAADEELWSKVKGYEGVQVMGVVRRLTEFGAFVDIGGVDGLVHVTDMTWGRVRDPKDILKVGDEINVLVMKVDTERKRISLGLKQTKPKPWQIAPQKYIVGDIVQGKVVRLVSFGAFVELEPDIDGLVHISQIADHRIGSVEEVLKVGDIVDVKILDVNPTEKRISLSIRDAKAPEFAEPAVEEEPAANEEGDVIYSTDDMDRIKAYESDDEEA